MSDLVKFKLGHLSITPGARDLLKESNTHADTFLKRHTSGDWGNVSANDKAENDFAIGKELRIFSAYETDAGKLWVITEADRSSTTLLLPDEY